MLFPGDNLQDMKLVHPLTNKQLPIFLNATIKPTIGTGINTVSPAHNIDDLKFSFAVGISRDGCVDARTGKFTSPPSLSHL